MSGKIAQKNMTNEELATIARTVAKKHGYEEATASFMGNKDAKIRWTRSWSWISLEVTDYLAVLDAETMAECLEEIFHRIETGEPSVCPVYEGAVMSKEFRDANRATFIRRSYSNMTGAEGTPDVQASYERLCNRGMLKHDPELTFRWKLGTTRNIAMHASAIFKTVIFNDRLADAELSDEDVDYLVYCAVIRATRKGLSPADSEHAKALMDAYPDAMAHRRALEAQGIVAI